MPSSLPPETLETLVGWLLPPACKEEVLGDLCERYKSPARYLGDAVRVIPCVIVSRIRRTSDAQELAISAMLVYASMIATAWWMDRDFLNSEWGLLRLFIPSVQTLVLDMFAGAWRKPGDSGVHWVSGAMNVILNVLLLSQLIPHALVAPGWIASFLTLMTCNFLFPTAFPGMQRAGGAVSSAAVSKPFRAVTLIAVVLVSAVLLTGAGLKPSGVSIVVFVEAIVLGRRWKEKR